MIAIILSHKALEELKMTRYERIMEALDKKHEVA